MIEVKNLYWPWLNERILDIDGYRYFHSFESNIHAKVKPFEWVKFFSLLIRTIAAIFWLTKAADYVCWNDLEHLCLFYLYTFLVCCVRLSGAQKSKNQANTFRSFKFCVVDFFCRSNNKYFMMWSTVYTVVCEPSQKRYYGTHSASMPTLNVNQLYL